ncbi:uncharacterized protein [Parasteatoda tepidariorum]|uniref:uncharacterized protein n=1 Tax=Parasteatoda tepidariorum TaxID=114398 RepID=UPI001C71B8E8|nr:uncharacterized protein LOC107447399 isoform X2 [Parasteatoda tepidariorum]
MERYFLFIFDGVHAEEESFLLNYFGSDETTCDEPLQSSNQFYHSSYVYFLNLKERCKKLTEWKEVNATQYITQLLSKSGDNIDEGSKIEDTYDSSSIAECINSLADLLPLPGTFVLDVIVGCNVFENFSVSDNVQFAASLHRLSKWHSAHTSWLSRKTDSNVKEWLDLTNAEEINVNSFSKLTLPFWRGSIEFKDIGISTQCYNGFELRIDSESKEILQYLKFVFNISTSEYLLFNPVLKVTDLCCFSSVPQHLILPVVFNLCVSENSCYHSSVKLCANIKEKNDAALILRMGYSVLKEKPKPDKLLSTSRWLKIISSGNVKYPESCFPFVDKHLTLVVVPSPNSNCMSAYVVRDSTHLDAHFFFNAVSTQNRQSLLTSGTKVTDYLVPSISKTTFLSTVEEAIRLHAASDESGTCENQSSVDTSDLLTTFIQCIDSSELVKCYNNFSDVDATYYEIDPSDWAERINLLQRQIRCDEETKHKKNVFMSFSPKRSRYYVSFSGEDIKKYFEPSGEPKVNKTAEPIQSVFITLTYLSIYVICCSVKVIRCYLNLSTDIFTNYFMGKKDSSRFLT